MKALANAMKTALQKMRDGQVGSRVVVRQGELMRDQEEEIKANAMG